MGRENRRDFVSPRKSIIEHVGRHYERSSVTYVIKEEKGERSAGTTGVELNGLDSRFSHDANASTSTRGRFARIAKLNELFCKLIQNSFLKGVYMNMKNYRKETLKI